MEAMPRLPRYELKCHPAVWDALKAMYADSSVRAEFIGMKPEAFGAIDVHADEELLYGSWTLFRDGEAVKSGNIIIDGTVEGGMLLPPHVHDDDGTVEGCPGCFTDPRLADGRDL